MLSNVYLHDVDLVMEKAIETTRERGYPSMTFVRYADDRVVLVNTHPAYKRTDWLLEGLERRLGEEFEKLGVSMNLEKSTIVELKNDETFSFLGFDFRLVKKRKPEGKKPRMVLQTPRTKKRSEVLREVREVVERGGSRPTREVIRRINEKVRGWVNYFRWGNSAKVFSYVRYHVEKRVRRFLMKRKGRRGFGWKRWDERYLYEQLGLFNHYYVCRYHSKALPERYAT